MGDKNENKRVDSPESVAVYLNIIVWATDTNSLKNIFSLSARNNFTFLTLLLPGGGRVERRCWVNFQCRGVLLVLMMVGQGPIALAVGAGGGLFFGIFSLI